MLTYEALISALVAMHEARGINVKRNVRKRSLPASDFSSRVLVYMH
jgi:hypothetical protein